MELDAVYTDNACKAALELEYYQNGAEVHVESLLTNPDCGASSGSYTIEVRLRDDDGVVDKKTFDETWQRDDDSAIQISRDFPVGDDVDVVRVRPRKLRCECMSEEPQPVDENPEQ